MSQPSVTIRALLLTLTLTVPGASLPAQPAPSAEPVTPTLQDRFRARGLFTVQTIDETWHDDARNRDVPVRIYLPSAGGGIAVATRPPVVIFSHGLGGSGLMYEYFGEHLASHGYLVIAPTHAGSDTAALRAWIREHERHSGDEDGADAKDQGPGWLKASIEDPENLKQRPRDISFVIDQAARSPTVSAIADLTKIGVAGHSFGAYTAMAVGGMLVDLPDATDTSFRDERVKAVLPMSPEGKGTMGIGEGSWDRFVAPVLFLTGTKDYGAGQRAASWRREAFDSMRGVDAYLATIDGATHSTFSGMSAEADGHDAPRARIRERVRERVREKIGTDRLSQPDPDEAAHLEIVRSLSVAFFDAYLEGDPEAKEWLTSYFAATHADCRAEFRPADPRP